MQKERILRKTNLKSGRLCLGQEAKSLTWNTSGCTSKNFICNSFRIKTHITKRMKAYGLKYSDFGKVLNLCGIKTPITLKDYKKKIFFENGWYVDAFKVVSKDENYFYVAFDYLSINKKLVPVLKIIQEKPYVKDSLLIFNHIYNCYTIEVVNDTKLKEKYFTVKMVYSNIVSMPDEDFVMFDVKYYFTDSFIKCVKEERREKDGKIYHLTFKVERPEYEDNSKLKNNLELLETYFLCIAEDAEHEKEVSTLLNLLGYTNKDFSTTKRVLYEAFSQERHLSKEERIYTFEYDNSSELVVFKVHYPGFPVDTSPNFGDSYYFVEDEKKVESILDHGLYSVYSDFDQRVLNWCIKNKKKYSDVKYMLSRLGFVGDIYITYSGRKNVFEVEAGEVSGLVLFDNDGTIKKV